ncbi:hypothetical protein DAPK24_033520 [Pichia kluyveri]|uniref:DNA replication checkpoint mediator MRC1 domain-containing protein n=1 Tax=Pichia kluyveri TaxID=36015 RepID=A0AAV5R715_PICKL|nr:hypothetical protein DAPK24_033520 [Pichia kluyveri]
MEFVLTVAETNRLREQVGLKLIPDNGSSNGKGNRKHGKGDGNNMINSLSIAETNKLRAKLGLKLIPDESNIDKEFNNFEELETRKRQGEKLVKLVDDIETQKQQLKLKNRIERGGIIDRLDKSSNDGSNGDLDLDSWLSKVGGEIKRGVNAKRLVFKNDKKSKKIETELKEEDIPDVKISHDNEKINEMIENGNEVVLTLKDSNVLDDKDEDELVNQILQHEEEILRNNKEKNKLGKLVTLDDHADASDKKRKLESLEIESDDDDDDDDILHLNYDENLDGEKKINKIMKRDFSKFKKPKKSKSSNVQTRKRIIDEELEEREFKPVILNDDDDDVSSSIIEDDLEKVLNESRKLKLKLKLNLKEIVNDDVNKENKSINSISESLEFLDNIKVDEEIEESVTKDNEEQNGNELLRDNLKPETESRYRTILDDEENKFNNNNKFGISSVLQSLKSNSSSKNNNGKLGSSKSDDVKIVYTDDDGNVLDTKQAFKYMSHKFHGSKKK